MIRKPTEQEKSLYRKAVGETAPGCIVIGIALPGWSGALGPLVFNTRKDRPDLIVHEMVHVSQFYAQPFTFWIRYLYQLATKGYMNISYEVEAYAMQSKVLKELSKGN